MIGGFTRRRLIRALPCFVSIVVCLVLLPALLVGCSGGADADPRSSRLGFDGEEVRVEGEVTRVRGPHAIDLGGVSRDRVVVVMKRRFLLRRGDQVAAVGRLRPLDLERLQLRLGIDLADHELAEVQGDTVLVAVRVQRLPPGGDG